MLLDGRGRSEWKRASHNKCPKWEAEFGFDMGFNTLFGCCLFASVSCFYLYLCSSCYGFSEFAMKDPSAMAKEIL